ncbi:sugar phosphate isomerase/epimerase family protein [Entomohabitans teleogrylli]|uniref:sugar phosphate isomerase/epimerase family protein n=1 Tax=Entomohabitans teleogrylli TaxID=1384589 RepID=UPI00073D3F73|nr:sugar phosphate isomerase/epimerase family protein [Entomohabitans teleogrylli]
MRNLLQRPDLYSINTATLGFNSPLPAIIDACAQRGIGAIAPWRRELENQHLPDIARQLAANNMAVSGLCRSSYYTAPTLAERRRAIADNQRALDDAAQLNAACYIQVVGGLAQGSKDLDEARNQVKEGIRQLLPHSRAVGVPLALEPLHPMTTADRSCLCTLRQALDWCDELDPDGEFGLGVAVDVYHVWWDPDLASQIRRAGKRILAFHVSDWLVPTNDLVNGRGMPGDGVIDIPAIRQWVENTGFNGAIELEIFSSYWWQKDINHILDISVDRIAHYC